MRYPAEPKFALFTESLDGLITPAEQLRATGLNGDGFVFTPAAREGKEKSSFGISATWAEQGASTLELFDACDRNQITALAKANDALEQSSFNLTVYAFRRTPPSLSELFNS